jgi:hypothetical protein
VTRKLDALRASVMLGAMGRLIGRTGPRSRAVGRTGVDVGPAVRSS